MVATATNNLSERARRVLDVLRAANAYSAERALTDREIAKRARVPQRDVVEITGELLRSRIPVIASCGGSRSGTRGKGRFIERDPDRVDAYRLALRKRGTRIMLRSSWARDCAALMQAKRPVETNGQGRLFA